ncbi:serine protein kinase RIO [Microbacterium sp. NPDC091676]|uniref:serine protein kinase RIO n=1 Tax=Microbacterium sp. NPDC091676 TaxID=3364212 RepID=UPI0037FE8A09
MTESPASSEAASFDATPFDALETALSFAEVEPGPDQRWTTWPSSTPTERGPEPRPAWVVTSAGALDTELGILKTGKEADVFLLERAVPGDPTQRTLLAAKRYRGIENRSFQRSAVYTEGRSTRNTRDTRALAKKTAHGRDVAAAQWSLAEFEALCRMWERGAPVPYPVQVSGTEVLMEFLGDDRGIAAPRLAQVRGSNTEMQEYFTQVVDLMRVFAAAGFAHGDLSAYNLLVHDGRVRVIDLPQIVDVIANPQGLDLLHRDCVNVCDWFARRRVDGDAEALFADLLGTLF